jgi:hypothetical protein
VRAADALGRYVAHGGELRIADAEDGERITCLIILPGETAGAVSAAVGNGQWRERHGTPPPDANEHTAVDAEQQKNAAYAERNRLVAALAKCFPAHLCRHEEPGYEDDWRNIVCIHLPTGQATWHIHDSEVPLFGHLPVEDGHWDGHTTEEKYARLASVEPWRPVTKYEPPDGTWVQVGDPRGSITKAVRRGDKWIGADGLPFTYVPDAAPYYRPLPTIEADGAGVTIDVFTAEEIAHEPKTRTDSV